MSKLMHNVRAYCLKVEYPAGERPVVSVA